MVWHEDISIEVVKILESGKCPEGHQVGEKFDWKKERGKLCPHAVSALFPYIIGLQSGGSFPWETDPESALICCPDPNNPVVFKITSKKTEASK